MYYVGAVIKGPSSIIYFPGQELVQLTCEIFEGSTGWSVNGSNAVTLSDINNSGLPGHSLNGTSLVINTPMNNTEYVCVSISDDGNLQSDPVFLFVAGKFTYT